MYAPPTGTSRPKAPHYKRDLVGYGRYPPDPKWPGGARVAVQLVINYEEGSENCVLDGDGQSEHLLSEIVGAQPYKGVRHVNMESMYEYGSRAGFWRLFRMFTERSIPCTVYACALALERNPEAAQAMVEAGWEVASHGYRWWDYQYVDEATEKEHIKLAVEVQQKTIGQRPLGIYQGKPNENTLKLVVEEGGFLYNSDSYADDLPYWNTQMERLLTRWQDMRFSQALEGDRFFNYLKDAFDVLYAEGEKSPKMMSVGLHCRVIGRPGRALGLAKFLDYIKSKEKVWICRRIDICNHWYQHHKPISAKL
ncbi:hypothetical protein GUITHDRAFT_67817 [Guillardia theta CCMP2712]|uniref:NodB homology domain-containing protein n=1 Tax=Guillardia theta (strain CCMP2712) TaxID=905079 RepID=L1JND7_GUITC|nr:hypothetical protein GUITHDRAFT_67817 [Guillardia theta CCMP2712]EKX49593.1 hypothetical protein GUITHDRAFT_67817 [Guillardia theta CCMP2712]|eukprot:XP_005836573.1 hypothetical protein GUITHDRAFT_67817 [Guillardia theta CCMP2712]